MELWLFLKRNHRLGVALTSGLYNFWERIKIVVVVVVDMKKSLGLAQGFKKIASGCPGKVDFCSEPVTFPTHLPNGQGYGQAAHELS